jgi:hypothetical protein
MDAFRHPRLRRPRIPDFLESGRQDRPTLEALLDEAEKYVQLRHGVVHGIYRENHLLAQFESRRTTAG